MNKKLKSEKGITMVTLIITVIALATLSITVIANTKSMVNTKNITELKNDISNLRQKVTDFYNEYGELPAEIEYTNTSRITNVLSEKEKSSKFYVIDLQAMQGISLNYGMDYEHVKNTNTETANKYYDLYIINEETHNIFYMEGVIVRETGGNKRQYTIYEEAEEEISKIGYTTTPVAIPEENGEEFSRANGKIDILFLEGTTYNVGEANKPAINENSMIPLNWNGTNWVVTDEANWDYSYDQTNRKWANAMLSDGKYKAGSVSVGQVVADSDLGSMIVWLPRYAYKITYYAESDTNKTGDPIGYSDARGFVDSTGKTPTGMETPVTSIAVRDNYRPHPAFEDGSETGYTQGEWSSRLTGIWMGKFETTPKGADGKITILPNTESYRAQTIGQFYTDAQELGVANSHMAKNSEWGAMAYLTESKYGRDGTGVTQNSANSTTGQGNYKINVAQSTTKNVYGIYDTVGGTNEYTVGYVADSSKNYGNSFASIDSTENNKTESTQYATVYAKTTSNNYIENYAINTNKVFGDGIIETSTAGSGTTSWHLANSYFVGLSSSGSYPFLLRGGGYTYSCAGSFCFYYYDGNSGSNSGFRVCFAVK